MAAKKRKLTQEQKDAIGERVRAAWAARKAAGKKRKPRAKRVKSESNGRADEQLEAMTTIRDTLEDLSPETRRRIKEWLADLP
jgi:DNA invertase Pin-like site-specific DNA recombinase